MTPDPTNTGKCNSDQVKETTSRNSGREYYGKNAFVSGTDFYDFCSDDFTRGSKPYFCRSVNFFPKEPTDLRRPVDSFETAVLEIILGLTGTFFGTVFRVITVIQIKLENSERPHCVPNIFKRNKLVILYWFLGLGI